jgi:TRAP-type mannitol/chloroaromatic compound transport system substrate-binding protein
MSWKAFDRYSADYQEMQSKDKVRFFKTPDAILKKQLEIYDDIVTKKAAENPIFKEILASQVAFAKRVAAWEQDTVTPRRMAYDHYFGANGASKKFG